MHAKLILVSLLGIAPCAVFAPFPAEAQTRQSVWDGIYTDAQADRGRAQYAGRCAMCHGPALEGNGEAPPLTGEFIPDWAGMTLADLTDKIRITMPLNAPGTLGPAAAADILAYILKADNFPAGSKELGSDGDSLAMIGFDVFKPAPPAAPPAPPAKARSR